MVGSGSQGGPLTRDHYRRVIREIMAQFEVTSLYRPDHVVRAETALEDALQNTDWYVVGDDNASTSILYRRPHYRYDRYMEALQQISNEVEEQTDGRRLAHIDIGCGAGLFSWVFLDWARTKGIGYDCVDLYGYDHSPQMIRIATESRSRLMQIIPDYPSLHYDYDLDTFRRRLFMTYHPNTDYIVTFGYVLAQTFVSSRSSIEDFARIIDVIFRLPSSVSMCELLSVDSTGRQNQRNSIEGWNLLLENLQQQHNIFNWEYTPGNLMYALLTDDDNYPFP